MNKKVFNDAVHGSIELHPLCVKFIDTPQFQRLRFIKQLGMSSFVFHSGGHNRFEHCIGVCYLAGQFARTLKEHQPDLKISEIDVLCVEIAGLCHDLGHGPFSHLWEEFVKKANPQSNWKHEKTSIAMIEHLITVNELSNEIQKYGLTDLDLIFIKELISPKEETDCGGWPYKGRTPEKSFLYQIVANSRNGVDVDKWDYFLRDSYSLGLKVTFDYLRLMKFARVINISSTREPNLIICYRDKEEPSLYDMFHTRMLLHRKAYQHRVCKTLDTMLVDALILANEHITYKGQNGKDLRLCDVVNDLSAMTYLHDDIFHAIYRNTSTEENMKKAKNIIHNILTRNYYPYVGHALVTLNELLPENIRQVMMESLPQNSSLKSADLNVQLININYGNKDKNPILNVGFFTKDSPDECKFRSEEDDAAFTMHPKRFEETTIRILCRQYEADKIEEAKHAFSQTCDKLGIKHLQGTPWSN